MLEFYSNIWTKALAGNPGEIGAVD